MAAQAKMSAEMHKQKAEASAEDLLASEARAGSVTSRRASRARRARGAARRCAARYMPCDGEVSSAFEWSTLKQNDPRRKSE